MKETNCYGVGFAICKTGLHQNYNFSEFMCYQEKRGLFFKIPSG